jgi:hypothetical protein
LRQAGGGWRHAGTQKRTLAVTLAGRWAGRLTGREAVRHG